MRLVPTPQARQLRRGALGAAVALAAAGLVTASGPAAQAAGAATVTVNARAGLATVPSTGLGVNDAAWVRYANVTKGYGAKYWEIGNEIYGNGHYGADWEADSHPAKTPVEYANNVVAYADAMKAVDPSVKIGAVLTTPANWPDAVLAD